MPATAGRVRMPANNRVHSSAALQTHGMWRFMMKLDPYAPNEDFHKGSSVSQVDCGIESEGGNTYDNFQGLMSLVKITNSYNNDEVHVACKRCGHVGHLSYQCRNFISLKDSKENDADEMQANVLKASVRNGRSKGDEESEEESEEESNDSDFSRDSEIEWIVAEWQGKRFIVKSRSSRNFDEDKKGRRRSKKRSGNRDEVDSGRKRKRKRDESSDEDEEHKHRRRRDRKEKRRIQSYTDDESSDEDEERRHLRRMDRKERRRRHQYLKMNLQMRMRSASIGGEGI